jgi:hypothetical protein
VLRHARQGYPQKWKKSLRKRRGKAHHHRTRMFDLQTNEFEIRCKRRYASAYSAGDTIQQCQLRSNEATCTCNKPKLQHIPCSHVIAACKDMGDNDASQYISLFYTAEALKNTWRSKMRSYATSSNYKAIEGPTWIPYRSRGTRMRGDMDAADVNLSYHNNCIEICIM